MFLNKFSNSFLKLNFLNLNTARIVPCLISNNSSFSQDNNKKFKFNLFSTTSFSLAAKNRKKLKSRDDISSFDSLESKLDLDDIWTYSSWEGTEIQKDFIDDVSRVKTTSQTLNVQSDPYPLNKSKLPRSRVREYEDRAKKIVYPGNEKDTIAKVLRMGRVVKVTKGGKISSYSVLVVVGNQNGVAGFGLGKSKVARQAVQKAFQKARADKIGIERYDGHTTFYDLDAKYGKSLLKMRSAPEGTGIIANRHVRAVCQAFGLRNIVAKVHGSRNPHNVVKAAFKALGEMQSPANIALKRGKKVLDLMEQNNI